MAMRNFQKILPLDILLVFNLTLWQHENEEFLKKNTVSRYFIRIMTTRQRRNSRNTAFRYFINTMATCQKIKILDIFKVSRFL